MFTKRLATQVFYKSVPVSSKHRYYTKDVSDSTKAGRASLLKGLPPSLRLIIYSGIGIAATAETYFWYLWLFRSKAPEDLEEAST